MDVETFAHQPQMQHAGRGDRVARTREAIIASALALALAGEVAPIVRDIAKMAGVSARTVFQHFSDTAELYVAVLGRVLAAVVGEAPDPGAAWPIEERVATIINQCSERCERLLPMWTFVETLQRRSSDAAARSSPTARRGARRGAARQLFEGTIAQAQLGEMGDGVLDIGEIGACDAASAAHQ